jgi:hypothetical protein
MTQDGQLPVRLVPKAVLSPYVPPRGRGQGATTARALPLLPRLKGLQGSVIAFWNDSAAEGDVVQPVVEAFLRERGAARVIAVRQPGPSFAPLPENLEAAEKAEAVILGVAA